MLAALGILLALVFVVSAAYVHLRGRVRHELARQLTDHSTFVAPYNAFVYLFSKVPNRPLLDRSDFPELDRLRDRWTILRDEAQALLDGGHLTVPEAHHDLAFHSFVKRGWKRFYFKWYDDPMPSARALAPRTIALLEQVPSVHAAMLTVLPPGSRLGAHRDPFAGSVRYHLGLLTPNSDDCWIQVDDQVYSWRDGEDVLFDETFIHKAKNDTDQLRVIFFADVERPLRGRIPTAINRFAIRHVLRHTRARNVPTERIGALNRVFSVFERARTPFRRLKARSKRGYYALKYAAIATLVVAILVWL